MVDYLLSVPLFPLWAPFPNAALRERFLFLTAEQIPLNKAISPLPTVSLTPTDTMTIFPVCLSPGMGSTPRGSGIRKRLE